MEYFIIGARIISWALLGAFGVCFIIWLWWMGKN